VGKDSHKTHKKKRWKHQTKKNHAYFYASTKKTMRIFSHQYFVQNANFFLLLTGIKKTTKTTKISHPKKLQTFSN